MNQMIILASFILLILINNSASALTPADNPGATCQGILGSSKGSLINSDYNTLVSATNTGDYVDIAGNASGNIPLQIRISTSESNPGTVLSEFGVIESSGFRAINIKRNFPNVQAYTEISLDFRNSVTLQPILLTNVALSAFDIDYSNSYFHDAVKITGITKDNVEIIGIRQNTNNSNVTGDKQGLFTKDISINNCSAKNLSPVCQGSIKFSEAVKSVKIRYGNYLTASNGNNATIAQEIDFRVDNYCYVPEYIFSGTVFDDNGGIPENRASKDNSDITSPISVYANKPSYFNGTFDKPIEKGIADSSVKLTNCATNPTTIYPTQSVIRDGAPVGEYQISIPKTTLGTNTNLCLLESRTGNTYPIRTSTESIKVSGFSPTVYNYSNNNFGRVIAENAALVLRKAQYVNDCPSTLDYSASTLNTSGNTNPRTGFSESSISGSDLIPGQCIAYKITATNRSNLNINDFVMQDTLQKKGVNNSRVTSVLADPQRKPSDFSDSYMTGQNGTLVTKPFILEKRTKRDFYFNTKYGTTVEP